MKVAIVVDNSYVYQSCITCKVDFNNLQLNSFFKEIIDEGDWVEEIIWCRPQTIICRPEISMYNAKRHLAKKRGIKKNLKYLDKKELAEAEEVLEKAMKVKAKREITLRQAEHIITTMLSSFPCVKFPIGGIVRLDPFYDKPIEKGMDVVIAIQMIQAAEKYEKIILISGDNDFIPAIDYLHEKYNTHFKGVVFSKKGGNVSLRLSQVLDSRLLIKGERLKELVQTTKSETTSLN